MATFNGTVAEIENNTNKVQTIDGTEGADTYPSVPAVLGLTGAPGWQTLYSSGANSVKYRQSGGLGVLEVIGSLDWEDITFPAACWPAGAEAWYNFDLAAVFSPTGALNGKTLALSYSDDTHATAYFEGSGTTAYYFIYPLG